MKKLVLTVLGFFTLMVCSEEVYQENIGDTSEDSGYTVFTHEYAPGQYRDYILSLTTDLTTVRITLQ